LKDAVDEAVATSESVEHVLVVRRTGIDVDWTPGRDLWWHDVVDGASPEHEPEAFDAEHPLFLLYTSGTTGKPKGIVHSTGGYLTQASYTHFNVFDVKPEHDVFWCTADIGWVTGHTYIVYGPLSNGVTQIVYEGTPASPDEHRHFQIIEKYGVTIYYTAPTLIRTFMKLGRQIPAAHDLSSLRLLGSVGEPINPEAWRWYRTVFGNDATPIVDTWWQTETGAIMIAPMPGATSLKPGSGTLPLPGVEADLVDLQGKPVGANQEGYLVIRHPWPSMFRTLWHDPQRYEDNYFKKVPGAYMTGDAARRDEDGYYWILGRVDDVMNVSGHRLSTMEIESALVRHPAVAEAAVVGKPHEITGQSVVCFVTLKKGDYDEQQLGGELKQWIAKEIGAFARPEQIRFTEALPKTRSGKIMRRLLREIVTSNSVSGDVTTLEDLSVLARLSSHQDED
jgi:acetyl-CoA synthetase